jgi:hypothetical protein
MSRKGDCWDNAVAESFFGTLKAELVDHEQYRTHEAARHSIGDYIDTFYNIERRHSFLDYLNPIEFELRSVSTSMGWPVSQGWTYARSHWGGRFLSAKMMGRQREASDELS